MKNLVLVLICSFSIASFGQTPIISHKSHSGRITTYFIEPNANFGEIQMYPQNFRSFYYDSINDTTVIRRVSNGYTYLNIDTVKNGQRESLDAFRKEDIRIQRYKMDSLQRVEDSLQLEQFRLQNKSRENGILPTGVPGNHNPPSFLLVLVAVSALSLVLIRLFFRERKPSISEV